MMQEARIKQFKAGSSLVVRALKYRPVNGQANNVLELLPDQPGDGRMVIWRAEELEALRELLTFLQEED